MKRILIVEDDIFIRDELVTMLEMANYQVDVITYFIDTTQQILNYQPDLLLLDLNLPNENGFQICQNIKQHVNMPILVLTSREQLKDEIYALQLGADEYLTKPFRKERLLIRIENIIKRYQGRMNLIEGVNFLLDRQTFTLYINHTSIVLPHNQGKLLVALLTSQETIVSKETLAQQLWGTTEYIDNNALQVNMTRLKKIMQQLKMAYQIKSIRGIGYQLIRENHHE